MAGGPDRDEESDRTAFNLAIDNKAHSRWAMAWLRSRRINTDIGQFRKGLNDVPGQVGFSEYWDSGPPSGKQLYSLYSEYSCFPEYMQGTISLSWSNSVLVHELPKSTPSSGRLFAVPGYDTTGLAWHRNYERSEHQHGHSHDRDQHVHNLELG
jgi:hypothetical protein